MKKLYDISLFIVAMLGILIPATLSSQDLIKTEGRSEVRLESNMTKDQAREKAEDLAKIDAIAKVNPTYVDQVTDIIIKEGRANFDIIGNTKVRGEWIRTIKKEINEETRETKGALGKEQEVWIVCTISGEIRECVSRANIEFNTLNCPIVSCRQTVFINGESLYLYFKSPVNGYLSVFLDDGENTYRLLPYKSMGALSAVEILGDKQYIFFSRNKDDEYDSQHKTDAMELYTDKEIEYNNIYVAFAESPYVKPILNDIKELEDGYLLPKSIKTEDFLDWLSDCRAAVTDFQSVRVRINIKKK